MTNQQRLTLIICLLLVCITYGGKTENHFCRAGEVSSFGSGVKGQITNKIQNWRNLKKINRLWNWPLMTAISGSVIVEDSSWKEISSINPTKVLPYLVDNNPLQMRTRCQSGICDKLQIYFYKSAQTYIGTLIIRYSVSYFISIIQLEFLTTIVTFYQLVSTDYLREIKTSDGLLSLKK